VTSLDRGVNGPQDLDPAHVDRLLAQTDLTPEELDTLARAYDILTRLGQQTAIPTRVMDGGPLRGQRLPPTWNDFVFSAHHNLALILIQFSLRIWRGKSPWTYPKGVRQPP
jgi:hypothetical protein